jgi:hypothetical protein
MFTLFLFATRAADAQDDLKGKTLSAVDQMESALEAGIGALVIKDRDKVRGTIREIKVTESNERATTLEVTYRGFENGEFKVEVLDPQKRAIRAIGTAKYTVPAGDASADRKATIVLELSGGDDVPAVQSSRIKLRISKTGVSTAQIVNVYGLDKEWSPKLAPQNVVVKVTPAPVGGTAAWVQRLRTPAPGGPGVVVGPRPLQPHVRRVVLHDVAATPASTPAPAPAEPVAMRRPLAIGATAKIARAGEVETKNQQVISRLPRDRGRISITDYTFATAKPPATPASTEPTNQVTASYVDLLGELTADNVDIQPSDLLGVFSRVYPDSNANSGVFYYIPRGYRLSYDSDLGGAKGLGFRIAYDRRGSDSEAATVRMAASFDSAVDLSEIKLAEKILQSIDQQDPSFTFKPPLRPFPLAAPPAFDFSGALKGLVKSEDIAVVALSDSLEGIDLSWSTDPVDAQNIRRDLRDGIPISGVAAFDAPNSDAPTLIVPARVELTDPGIYKALKWSRSEEIRNASPFPVILKNLHVLTIENNKPRLYSWALGDAVLQSAAKLELDLTNVPREVDSKAERMWIQYSLDRRCEDCIDRVLDQILSGDVWPDTGKVVLRTLTPLEMTGAAEIWADVRSRFFDPSERAPLAGPRRIMNSDRAEYTIEPIFLTNRMPPGGGEPWPLFEYRLSVVMPDGAIHEGTTWLPSDSDTVVVGPVQIEKSVGYVPGRP